MLGFGQDYRIILELGIKVDVKVKVGFRYSVRVRQPCGCTNLPI